MVRKDRPEEVQLPKGRRFLARYKRADKNSLPANIRIHKNIEAGQLKVGR